MRRRSFLQLIALTAVTFPPVATAQDRGLPKIGFLNSSTPERFAPFVAAFRKGLLEHGLKEGENVTVLYRWAENREDRSAALASDLIAEGVAVIAGINTTATTRAAMSVTKTVPIVFSIGGDPVRAGLVRSFSNPGGNVTGVSYVTNDLGPKRLELLRELRPAAARFGILMNPKNPNAGVDLEGATAAAKSAGVELVSAPIENEATLEVAFKQFSERGVAGFFISPDPLFISLRPRLLSLAAETKIPGIFGGREFVQAGGLMSYGPSMADSFRQNGIYAARILKGERPEDMPVLQPTTFEFVLNAKRAAAMGIEIPPSLLARADEIVE